MVIAHYILSQRKENHTLPKNGALVKTIVTTNMADALAKDFDVKLIEVLTGFKYIGEQIKFFEQQHNYEYVFGLEESYGCLVGTHARDKDAVVAVMALCEVAAYCKLNNKTLWNQMVELYEKYGYYKEDLKSITLKGIDGVKKIQAIMDGLRKNPVKAFGEFKVLKMRDYKTNEVLDMADGEISKTGLPTSNVLYYELEPDAWCCARPSGTEPKIKFYMGVKGESVKDADDKLKHLTEALLLQIGE